MCNLLHALADHMHEIQDDSKKKMPKTMGKAAADAPKGPGAGSAAERAAGEDVGGPSEDGSNPFGRDVIIQRKT